MVNKFVRTITSVLPVDATRTGSCNNCGECCKLPTKCMFLKYKEDGNSYCGAYRFRPLNCRKFPRTAEQHSLVKDVCGYAFPAQPKKTKTKPKHPVKAKA